MVKYAVRFGVLSSESISDKILVINPNYGERLGKYGSRHISKFNSSTEFMDKLEESILSEGIINPIVCFSINGGLFCQYGSNRLRVAKDNDIDLPVIVIDYNDKYSDLELLTTKEDILSKYRGTPIVEITSELVEIRGCDHIHL